MVTCRCVGRHWRVVARLVEYANSNAFLKAVSREYDSSFGVVGAKIGDTLRIRLPNDYVVNTGSDATAAIQNTVEQSVVLPVATQKFVAYQFSSAERALKMDDYSDRVLEPAINNLSAKVAADVMLGVHSVPNFVSNKDGSSNIISPTVDTWLRAGAILDNQSAPRGDWKIVMAPVTQAKTVNTMAGFFNPQRTISSQFAKGMITTDTLGFDWMADQTVINHTAGTFTAGSVTGVNTGTSVNVSLTGTLKVGDVITMAGCNAINMLTKQDSGDLRQFVVTAPLNAGAIQVYPAIVPSSSGNDVAYQTCVNSPTAAGAITLVTKPSETYRKNLAFHPSAVTLVTADLFLPSNGVIAASRCVYDSISMRAIDAYLPLTDQAMTRLDILYGYKFIRPSWAVVIADSIT